MYVSTLEIRFQKADAIYFLDIDTDLCLESVRQRKLQQRTDFPSCLDNLQGDFEAFENGIIEFEKKRKPKILALHSKYLDKAFVVLNSREEINNYLKGLIEKKRQ